MKETLFILLLSVSFAIHPAQAAGSLSASTTLLNTAETVVRSYFADTPVMIEIARCESQFRQFTDSGNLLRGGVDGQMVGIFQFFERYHEPAANDLGFDIKTLDGNLAYAKHVYTLEGTNPWESARTCWATPELPTVPDTVVESDDSLKQRITLLEQIIKLLQALLVLRYT